MVKTSLVEAYDDRDVIRQISKLTDEVKADTEVITEKAAAIDTALPKVEKAVEDAEDASTKAQTAAATALGIADRVTAVENSAAQNHSDITVLDGEVTDINNDLTNVVRKVTNDVQKVDKGLRVGEVPAGDDVVVSRKVLQDLLDAYEAMVRTSGNQTIGGDKTLTGVTKTNISVIDYRLRRGKSWLYNNGIRYMKVFRYTSNSGIMIRLNIVWGFNTPSRYGMADVLVSDAGICKVDYHGTASFGPGGVYLAKGVDGYTYLIVSNMGVYNGVTVEISNNTRYGQNDDIPGFEMINETVDTAPSVGSEYSDVIQGSAF